MSLDNRIWQKGDFFQFTNAKRIDMDPSVVKLPTEPIALVYGYDFDSVTGRLGYVDNVRLEDEEILGDLHFEKLNTQMSLEEIKDSVRLGGFYMNVFKNEAGDKVTSCDLKAVSIQFNETMPNFNPGASI